MDLIKRFYFYTMKHAITVVAKSTGKIHGLWTHKKTSQQDVENILPLIKDGDIILTRTRGELTTIAIPGYWKHTEIYTGDRKTVGAVSPFTRKTWLENIIHKTDYFVVLRLKDITEEERKIIVAHAHKSIGKRYDMSLDFINKSEVSCSELGYDGVNEARPKYLHLRKRAGFMTFTPQDFYDAKKKFILIYEKRS